MHNNACWRWRPEPFGALNLHFASYFGLPARLLRLWTAMPAPVWLSEVWRCGDGIAVGKPTPGIGRLARQQGIDLGRRLTELPRRRARLLRRQFQIDVGSAVSPGTLSGPAAINRPHAKKKRSLESRKNQAARPSELSCKNRIRLANSAMESRVTCGASRCGECPAPGIIVTSTGQ